MENAKQNKASAAPAEYQVLYFKRKNKVHKSKGVSKMDGHLSVLGGKSMKLLDDSSKSVYSSMDSKLTSLVFTENDEVALGHYQVEIVSVLTVKSSTTATASTTTTVKKTAASFRRKPLKPLMSKSTTATAVSRPATSSQPMCRSLPTATTTSFAQRRKPPAQPKKATEESDDDDDDDDITNIATLPVPPPPNKLLGKRKLLSAPSQPTTSTTTTTPTLILPASIRSVLRPHQEEGIQFLWNALTSTGSGAILADSMGLGKTLQTISIIAGLHRHDKQLRYVVVCPSSLVSNWNAEFDKWMGKASQPKRVLALSAGNKDVKQQLRAFSPVKPKLSQVLIVSYEMVRIHIDLIQNAKKLGLLVVDEGHRLKNANGSLTISALLKLQVDARLIVTGTPIQNNLEEFYTLADFCCPGKLGNLADFRRDFSKPMSAANSKYASPGEKCLAQQQALALQEITSQFVLQRHAKDVLRQSLPPRTELLLFCPPSLVQKQLYHRYCNNRGDALSDLQSLRKVCAHPSLVNTDSPRTVADSGKLLVLQQLLHQIKTTTDDKVIIVSLFTSTLDMIASSLMDEKQYKYQRLDGSTTDRAAVVANFQRASANNFCLLLSSKAGGAGLNLVASNRLVLFDADYNPATDLQAMGRIYRPGQLKPCWIYRLFTTGTLEEVVYQRQVHKRSLASMTMGGDAAGGKKLSADELKDCFTLHENGCQTKRKFDWDDDDEDDQHGDAVLSLLVKSHPRALTYIHVVPEEEDDDEEEAPGSFPPEDEEDFHDRDEEVKSRFKKSKEAKSTRAKKSAKPTFIDDEVEDNFIDEDDDSEEEEFEFTD